MAYVFKSFDLDMKDTVFALVQSLWAIPCFCVWDRGAKGFPTVLPAGPASAIVPCYPPNCTLQHPSPQPIGSFQSHKSQLSSQFKSLTTTYMYTKLRYSKRMSNAKLKSSSKFESETFSSKTNKTDFCRLFLFTHRAWKESVRRCEEMGFWGDVDEKVVNLFRFGWMN